MSFEKTLSTVASTKESQINAEAVFHMLVLYIIWGGTFIAIRIAVSGGFPPFLLGSMRVLVAGLVLLAWAKYKGYNLKPSRQELYVFAITGTLLWVGGNGLVVWAEKYVTSGYAALIFGSLPIWTSVIASFVNRTKPSLVLSLSLMISFLGIGFLNAPDLLSSNVSSFLPTLALLIAPFSWALGTVIYRQKPSKLDSLVNSGYQQVFGGIGFAIISILVGEPITIPTNEALIAWGYLVIFGSILAYTSFVRALNLLPTNIVMTYAYINPVVAVFWGWLLLCEIITFWTLLGMACILIGVAGVFQDQRKIM